MFNFSHETPPLQISDLFTPDEKLTVVGALAVVGVTLQVLEVLKKYYLKDGTKNEEITPRT